MLNRTKQPRLTLVGAGPGDEELITLKGIKALQEADTVLYDALANESLLDYVPKHCIRIYVGKRAGKHSFQQEEINQLIVQYAFLFGHVVRLKGGDPFVFGRGREEMEHAQLYHIPTTIVPGISSAVAVPALQNIPLTKRGVNQSFWVMTATTRSESLSQDMYLAAQSTATIVILMGMRKLARIVELFRQLRCDREPVAVIQNGTKEDEKVAIGVLSTIEKQVKEKGMGAPAIILIGEVVKENIGAIKEKTGTGHRTVSKNRQGYLS